jgi:excinuclease UvrABC nuclease subunit
MDSVQLHLFEPHKPLAIRLGSDFFSAAPPEPGVYVMTDCNERVIYIGQSGNLRARLGSYKNARLDRASRKTVRLVHNVERIAYETCPTVEAARVREAELLRVHRPRFNRVGTYPRAYTFITLRASVGGLEVSRGNEFDPAAEQYGAFKALALPGYAALLHSLWFLQYECVEVSSLPRQVAQEKPTRSFLFSTFNPELLADLRQFLLGTTEHLIARVKENISHAPLSAFETAFHTDTLNTLESFFQAGPVRNCELRERFGIESSVLQQEQLDDLLASSRRRSVRNSVVQ